ncbi:MAG: hypothetical protein HY669_03585 [Chloroflexi bacterium]|nr:hypothetical protein [Chloroflexota bacterium]
MAEPNGYAGKILRVDLSSGNITHMPTTSYADRFLGGRGIAAKIYWDEVSPSVSAFDPQNRLLFATGPLAGFPGLAASRWVVCGKSPDSIPEQFSYCNLGGSWGAQLKFAGYDAVVVQGKSERPVYLYIEDGAVEIRDASGLWGRGAIAVREILKGELGRSTRVVAVGPAGENLVTFASLLADEDSSGSGGLGAVMGSKRLKAIAVKGSGKVTAAQPEKLGEVTRYARELLRSRSKTWGKWVRPGVTRQVCYDCVFGCFRTLYRTKDGRQGKTHCQSKSYYQEWAQKYYGEWGDVLFYSTKLCDEYGLDTMVLEAMISWLASCRDAGVLKDKDTGIPLSKLGSLEFIESLVQKISHRDGLGDILARGMFIASGLLGSKAKELATEMLATRNPTFRTYGPRAYIIPAILYAAEPRQPIQELHEISRLVVLDWVPWAEKKEGAYLSSSLLREIVKKLWGSEIAADFSTYEGKALAARKIQDRQYAKESLVVCDDFWPISHIEHSESHIGDTSLESKILSAITGREVDEGGLHLIGERVFNLQRAILAREGHAGREGDKLPEYYFTTPLQAEYNNPECLVPGKDGEVISRKGMVLDREQFERMKGEYYNLRGWDVATGLQTRAKLEELGLAEVARDLEQRGLVQDKP